MHHLQASSLRTVELSSLGNGDVFVIASVGGHGHRTGIVFSERGVFILSGGDQLTAYQRASFDRSTVVACPD
ncbi:hypothetical protein L2Y94_09640 [Luteibacter aegosomatis]|uniref:hypothetical protein n=1 Tax=Luteibacter aegosomatis TaxID=2911537 RepID=UPI001FFA4F8F|nr:hypothetical protein [Luteibacter aegosomatis]UPG87591.1 hypothetical protein L2Y94_09640 [Luteibacter aegosomatis]